MGGEGGVTNTGRDRDTGTYFTNNTIIVESTYPMREDLGLLLPLQDDQLIRIQTGTLTLIPIPNIPL